MWEINIMLCYANILYRSHDILYTYAYFISIGVMKYVLFHVTTNNQLDITKSVFTKGIY